MMCKCNQEGKKCRCSKWSCWLLICLFAVSAALLLFVAYKTCGGCPAVCESSIPAVAAPVDTVAAAADSLTVK